MTEKKKNIDIEKIFLLEYREVGDFIRHYSSVRSALTVFLFALGLASFLIYLFSDGRSYLPLIAGHFLYIAALAVCLVFSFRTERANLYLITLWKWFHGESTQEPAGYKKTSAGSQVYKKMARDPMNWLLLLGMTIFLATFWMLDWN